MTINAPQYLDRIWISGSPCPFDGIIDVRSPAEFAEDHIPTAINLPVLDDTERADVGRIYHEIGAFEARRTGASIISRNIARHVDSHFCRFDKSYRPFLYCWRGGLRSASLATVLSQIGWRTTVLEGGYKTYRAYAIRELEALPSRYCFRLLAGPTGSGKTKFLRLIAKQGHQVLDLEDLACHRGSILGEDGRQPSQRAFESRLLDALARCDPARPVWVESESRRIGNRFLPPSFWREMQRAEGILIRVPMAARVSHLVAEYANLIARPQLLTDLLKTISQRRGKDQFELWKQQIETENWPAFVESLLTVHYDPGYERSLKSHFPNLSREVSIECPEPEMHGDFVAAVKDLSKRTNG